MALAIQHQKEMKLTQSSCKKSCNLRMFHEDFMSLILARLPLKSLCICKSVCKTWLSIISHEEFIKLYANHWKRGSRLLLSMALAIHHQKEMKLTQSSCKRSSSSSSSGCLGMFHEDVMSLILARLPLKSLCISKSVCKTWLSITSRPQFLKLYANQWNGGSRLLLSIRDGGHQRYLLGTTTSTNLIDFEEWFSLPFTKYHGVTQVINGLVCFYKGRRVWICNLTTGEIRELPSPYCNNDNDNNVRFAFGFDPISGAYKLIKLDRESGECQILILGDQDMSWKNNEVIGRQGNLYNRYASFLIWHYTKMEEAFCIDGSLYWLQGISGLTSFHLNQHFFAQNSLCMLDLHVKIFGTAVLQFRGRPALPYKTSDRSRHLHIKSLNDDGPCRVWSQYTFILPIKHKFLTPFSCLPTGEIMMVDPEFSDHCIYSYDLETQNLDRFVVGKFPISKMDSSARISCFQPNFNPLSLILKPNSGL